MDSDETRKEFRSGMPAQEKEWTHVARAIFKTLKILVGLYKGNVGQRSVGMRRWSVKIRPIIVFRSVKWDLAGVGTVIIT